MTSLVLKSATSGRYYRLRLNNQGKLFLGQIASGVTDAHLTLLNDRSLVNTGRDAAFTFGVKDTDLNNPILILKQLDNIHIGRAYFLLQSPNGREWEVTCTQSGVYKIKALTVDWPRAQAPILEAPDLKRWRFEVDAGGVLQVTHDPSEMHHRTVNLLSQDGTTAWTITVDNNGVMSVSDVPLDQARFYECELVAPTGERWLLRVDENGILYSDSEWQDAINRADDEWTVLIAERTGQLYVVDPRIPPPGAAGRRRVVNGYW